MDKSRAKSVVDWHCDASSAHVVCPGQVSYVPSIRNRGRGILWFQGRDAAILSQKSRLRLRFVEVQPNGNLATEIRASIGRRLSNQRTPACARIWRGIHADPIPGANGLREECEYLAPRTLWHQIRKGGNRPQKAVAGEGYGGSPTRSTAMASNGGIHRRPLANSAPQATKFRLEARQWIGRIPILPAQGAKAIPGSHSGHAG